MRNMTEAEVVALMKSSRTETEWNRNCDTVKRDYDGRYPDFWYGAIVASGLASGLAAIIRPRTLPDPARGNAMTPDTPEQPDWTPAPWRRSGLNIVGPDRRVIADCDFIERRTDETFANLDLISAAPDLYAALEAMIEPFATTTDETLASYPDTPQPANILRARQILRAARGES